MSTTAQEYRNFLQDASWYKHAGELNLEELSYLTMGLSGESGEHTDGIKKIARKVGFGDFDGYFSALGDNFEYQVNEVGDVLWYVIRIADFYGITVEQLMVINTAKLYQRMKTMDIDGVLPIPMPDWPFTHITFVEATSFSIEVFARGPKS